MMQTVRFLKRWERWPAGCVVRLPNFGVRYLLVGGFVELVSPGQDETATNPPIAETADIRPHIPNQRTQKVLEDSEAGRDLHAVNGVDDLFS
jgi:hypothetical protein